MHTLEHAWRGGVGVTSCRHQTKPDSPLAAAPSHFASLGARLPGGLPSDSIRNADGEEQRRAEGPRLTARAQPWKNKKSAALTASYEVWSGLSTYRCRGAGLRDGRPV